MKFLHIKSIQLKIALWASICLIVSGIVIVSYSATTARITAIKAAEERAIAEARIQAGIVKAEIEVGLDTARARAQELSAVRQLKNRLIINREQVNAMMRQVLVENPQYIGVWTLWEPNAFDGQDARYANTKTYGMTGRYFPYWNRGTGEISVEPIVDFDTGDWYQEPKRNKREYVSDLYTYPVMGKDVLMISIVAPIVANGTFYGVAGEDIPVTFLQELADKVNIYKGAGKLFLIGNNGKLVAATGQPEMRGRPLSELMAMQVSDEYVKVLQTGQERIKLTRDHVEAIVPIHFGRTLKPWAAMVILPSHVIVAPANELLWRLVAIALVMMLAGVGALWLVARHIARPIRQVTEIALRVASGDLTQTVVIGERHDELGKLAKGFNYMTQQLRSLYGTLEQRLHELKQASQSLGESEERFRSLVETSSDWIWEVNEQGIVTYASPKLNELLGYTPAEVMGKYLFDMMPPEEADRIRMQFSEIARSCRPIVNLVTTNQHKKGVSVILEICGVPVFDQAGVFHGYRGVARDITERKRAEKALRASEIRYRRLFESSKDGILILDADTGVIIDVNPFMIDLLGYLAEDYLGMKLCEADPFKNTDAFTTFFKEPQSKDFIRREDFPLITREGRVIEVEFISCVYSIDGENVIHCNIRDISLRKHAQEALKLQLSFLQTLINTIPSPIFYKDIEGKYLGCNTAFESFFNISGDIIAGKTASDFFPPDLTVKLRDTDLALFREPGIKQYEESVPSADGMKHEMIISKATFSDLHGKIAGLVGVMADITEQKMLEEQLRHSQKMEVIGQLAGGIAHDFNNILSVIIGFASLAQKVIKDDDPLRVNLDQILSASTKAANLTRSLLTFSRKQPIKPQLINLNEVVRNMDNFLARVIGEDIRLETVLRKDSLIINADCGQIEQILMNLATNARDAMPDGGLLTIKTELAKIDDIFIKTHGYGVPGNFAMLEITDTGSGIDEEVKSKIFEPYFTTKEVGKGTGLGLAIAYGIIQLHNGYINLVSEPGRGTTFRIYIPVVDSKYAEEEKPAPLYPQKGTETILLAEEDAEVRQLYLLILNEFGYDVLAAEDGQDAVDKYEANKDRIHLLLFDIVMPKKSGIEAYEEIKKLRSDIKVLFISGYDSYLTEGKAQTEECLEIIMKPIIPIDLARRVRCILDA